MNNLNLYGTVVRDFEIRHTQGANPTAIATSSVAYQDSYNKEKTHFFDVKAFGKTAENLEKYFKKGDPILFQGELQQETWEKDGQKFSKVVIRIDKFDFTRGSKRDAAATSTSNEHVEDENEESLPF